MNKKADKQELIEHSLTNGAVINGVPRELLERLEEYFAAKGIPYGAKIRTELRVLLTAQPQASAAQSAPTGAMTWDMQREAQQCLWVMREIACMDADDVTGDNVGLRFEDANGFDSGCDVSIVEYAERTAKVLESMLLAQSAPAGERETIRAVFLRNGFTVKEGQTDLKPYVYAAAEELLSIARASWQRTQSAGVPEGWRRAVYHAEECLTGCLASPDIASGLDVETVRKIIADLQAVRFAMLAAAPAQPAAQGEVPELKPWESMDFRNMPRRDMAKYIGQQNYTITALRERIAKLEKKAKPAAQDQGEVQRLRVALEEVRSVIDAREMPSELALAALSNMIDATLAASTRQEVVNDKPW